MNIAPHLLLLKMSDDELRAHLLQVALFDHSPSEALELAQQMFNFLRP